MHLLAIETATDICSVALYESGKMLAENTLAVPKMHAEALPILIQQVFQYSGQSIKSLDAIAISIGPGSFTGLRIGLSTAKGLIYKQKTSLLAIPTLAASAWSMRRICDKVGVIHHSYREHFFYASYQIDTSPEPIIEPIRLSKSELFENLPSDLPLVIQTPPHTLLENQMDNPVYGVNAVSAKAIGALALHQPENWKVDDPLSVEPDYLHEYKAVKYLNPLKAE